MQDHQYSLEDDGQPQSLGFMEDPYFITLDNDATPSLDEEPDDHTIEQTEEWKYIEDLHLDDSLLCVETEFLVDNRKTKLRIFKKKMKDVRVTFQDLSKPYLAKISSQNNYKKFLGLGGGEEQPPVSPAVEAGPYLDGMTPEEIEKQKAEWSQELARVEEEIATLRMVLASKINHSSELKRKLGISVWKEITDDVNQGLKNVKESHVYQNVENRVGQITKAVTDTPAFQKTESVIKTTAEKTSSLFGGITSKLGQMRNSESFRSIEEKMGSAYENVKGKVTSRSNSVQSFDEAVKQSNKTTPATSPTIYENKPFP